ncbi:MAG: hypothetical protein QGH94_04145 [Phycisphaerae bacterium]|jgi:hypothetical protein|nr:hypothetical protein [Phycisphaerae bacterium]
MRSAAIILIGCALVAFVNPAPVRGDGAMRIDELNELVKGVEAQAAAWARSKRENAKMSHNLRNIWYDQGSINPLRTVLEVERPSPNDLFVANRILAPMINAKPKVITEALGMIHTVSERLAVYKDLPTFTEAQLEAMAPPTDAPKSVMDLARKRRGEKKKEELAVQKHNQQARALRLLVYRLMVRARSREEDTRLLKALVVSEKNSDWMFADILEAIRSQARRMSEQRGKVLYGSLREFWNELRAGEGSGAKTYVDQGSVEIVSGSNSKYTTHSDIAKKRTLTVINQVASAAKMPALKDPKAKPPKKKKKTSTKRTRSRKR